MYELDYTLRCLSSVVRSNALDLRLPASPPPPHTQPTPHSDCVTASLTARASRVGCDSVENVTQLSALTLSDAVDTAQKQQHQQYKQKNHEPIIADDADSLLTARPVALTENTRLLGMMYHHPLSTFLEPTSPQCLEGYQDASIAHWVLLEEEPHVVDLRARGNEARRHAVQTTNVWLPHSVVDREQLDEYFVNHGRVSMC